MRTYPLVVVLAVAACGDDHHAAMPDAFVPPIDAAPFVEAPHPGAPQMVKLAGAVLATPKVVPIFFTGDATMQATIEDFLRQLAASSYWAATTGEYAIGTPMIASTIVTSDPPPTTDTDLKTWIAGHFTGQSGWPASPDPQAIYTVFLPDGVVLHTPFGDSCSAFGGFHDETADASQHPVIYALLPRCAGRPGFPALDELTVATSHELIEAASDPLARSMPAYQDLDPAHYTWAYTPGAELGDMCELLANAPQRIVGTYSVQRTWSNASAMAGHDPCVPALATPYIAAAPVLTESLAIDSIHTGGPALMTDGVSIPVGSSKTIDVVLYSDQRTGNYSVQALDVAQLFGMPAELTFAFDKGSGQNGDTLHLTITRVLSGTRPGLHQGSQFLIATTTSQLRIQSIASGFAGD